MYDIIPDIHGRHDKLLEILDRLGWRRAPSGWINPDPARRLLFLGDFIDRGPDNAAVIATVRALIDGGKAEAVMGNHEFSAIRFHTIGEATGEPLRERSAKNLKQHASFLKEFPIGDRHTIEVVDWMKSLPIWLEAPGLRAAHACWHGASVEIIRGELRDDRLDDETLQTPEFKEGALYGAIEKVTCGVEHRLPDGWEFRDKDGHVRRDVRIAWWRREARTWRDIAMSIPNPAELPATPLPEEALEFLYEETTPVLFGHYWLTGDPVVEAPNALCLDYSAGTDGPLVAYRHEGGAPLDAANITVGDIR